jgi:hypothetical protein
MQLNQSERKKGKTTNCMLFRDGKPHHNIVCNAQYRSSMYYKLLWKHSYFFEHLNILK